MRYVPEEIYLPTKRAPNMLAQPSWKFILSMVAMKHGVLQRDILGPSRSRKILAARWEVMTLIYRHTQASMPMVGRWLNKHHTTVLFGLRKGGEYTKLVDPLPCPEVELGLPHKPVHDFRAPHTALQRAVARAYRHRVPPSVLADELGCNPKSVSVLACRMGITRAQFRQKSKYGEAATA